MYEHNALGYWSGLALCLTKVRSSRARCPATALIYKYKTKASTALTYCKTNQICCFYSKEYIFCLNLEFQDFS